MAAEFTIRNYDPDDFASLARLKNLSAELSPDIGYQSPESVAGALARPGYAPQEQLFVAEAEGTVMGYMDVLPEPDIGRAVLDGYVDAGYRRSGIAGALYREATRRARASGARAVHVNVREGNSETRAVLEKTGFRDVHRSFEMQIRLADAAEPGEAALPIRPLGRDEADLLTQIQNRSFAGDWSFSANSVEQIRSAIIGSDTTGGIRIAMDGDRPAGYCWPRIQGNARGETWGRIGMIGVDPDYKGRGLGKQLLLSGLAYLRGRGLDVGRLTVDADNTVACSLYRSVGFCERDRSIWYEKVIDRGAG